MDNTKASSYKTKTPTMRDVAAAAGVSLSTVSLVVNGKPGVSHKRREMILKTIKELNYVPKGHQNSLEEVKIIGLLMESLSEASRSEGFYFRIVSGIEETAYELGHQVLLHVYRPEIDPLNSIRELMGRNVDGLIIANDGDITANVIQNLAESGIPMVLIENFQALPFHAVTADNFTAGRIMTEYLISLGHRRIGALCGPDKYSSLRDRLRGYRIAMVENGLPLDPSLQPSPVSGNPRKGYVQMQKLIESLELDFEEVYKRTNTSYKPYPSGNSDYKSASSVERIEAFIKLGVKDPVQYEDETGPVDWEVAKAAVEKVLADHVA